ncbi:hypothetical protein HYW40_00615 [Candidatus Curtissbacteria bacterium]|nr:hypothetical protein [Candidatus Curtissbacteria bacterium]
MEKSLLSKILAKIGIAILVVALFDLAYLNYLTFKTVTTNESRTANLNPSPNATVEAVPDASPQAQEAVEPAPAPSVIKETIVQTAQKEIFIPIGSGSTFNNNYTDLAGLEVAIDTAKYGAIESAVFEAAIWVQDGNGKMFAQLYNKTDGHPAWNSEISTSSAKGVLTTSGKVSLDSGAKTYKVQAKTNLTSYAAHVDNARVKITLK